MVPPAAAAARKERKAGRPRLELGEDGSRGCGRGWVERGRRRAENGRSTRRGRERRKREAAMDGGRRDPGPRAREDRRYRPE